MRSLKQVLPELLAQLVDPIAPGIFGNSSKRKAQEFLSRLFNQNEQARGLFYFHPDEVLGIAEAAVAYLRVAVSLRVQHYDVLRAARRAQLGQQFQAKFGWLVGNLYSRVASRDWADDPAGKKILAGLIESNIEEQITGLGPFWVDDEPAHNAINAGVGLDSLSREELRRTVEAHRPASKISKVVEVVVQEISKVNPTDEEKLTKLKNRLLNNGDLATLMK